MTIRGGVVFSADQVVSSLYNGILGRAPDPEGKAHHIRLLEQGERLSTIIRSFAGCPEAAPTRVPRVAALDRLPGNPIQLDLSAEQRQRLWEHVAKAWSQLGEQEPYYSVLTHNEFLRSNLSDDAVERFYASGEHDVIRAETYLARHGLELPRDGICVDYGCGLGRVTLWLARRFKRVLAIDVSGSHLVMARQALAARGITNVEFHQLRHLSDLSILQGTNFFHSMIVLQHNPPPIIYDILKYVFNGLHTNDIAFFQVPTYRTNYRWNFDQYIAEQESRHEIEMHVLPQHVVFRLAAAAACIPLEVHVDGYTGLPDGISNTFLFTKSGLLAESDGSEQARAKGSTVLSPTA